MRMKLLAIGLFGALSLTTAVNAGCGDCCDLDGCFEVGGEALYWKPTGADWQYAECIPESGTPIETKTVVGDYDWGFRIFGSYFSDDCCNFMTLDWTYLRTKDASSSAVSGADTLFIWRLDGQQDTVGHARLRFDYDKVNLRFGRYLCSGCNSRLYAFAGARYVNVEERRSFRFVDLNSESVFTFGEKTQFQGGGLEAGFGGEYGLFCDLSLVANVGLTAEVGRMKSFAARSSELSSVLLGGNYSIGSRTICVPGTEFRLGLSYTYKCDCWWITGDVGYQMDYRWNALALQDGAVIGSEVVVSRRKNVGFGGLYFGLRARF